MSNIRKPDIRYSLDFDLMPDLFFGDPVQFFNALEIAKGDFFFNIFTNFYRKANEVLFKDNPVTFNKEDFRITKYLLSKSKFMYYVEVSNLCEDSAVWCEAYGFVFDLKIAEESEFHFFTIEKTEHTRMLCQLLPDGGRRNYGDADIDMEVNAEKMLKQCFHD